MRRHTVKVLIACYGGGHVQSLLPVVRQLSDQPDISVTVLGFTTALATFRSAGIAADGYCSLLDADDAPWLSQAQTCVEKPLHPDVSEQDSAAYYALGLRDLHIDHGADKARELFARDGRKAFMPVHAMRRLLRRSTPDLVVATTSPRSELALVRAARLEGIESLAVSDLFLQHESSYICAPGYANHLTVMAAAVGEDMARRGFPAERIHVTGSPAFDSLFDGTHAAAAASLRQLLGMGDHQKLLLWACPSAPVSLIGKPFIDTASMIAFLEAYCDKWPDTRYLIRQHPSKPVVPPGTPLRRGSVCPPGVTIETCLHACDQVILETSTVGLQAALLGKPVVTVGAGDYPPYAAYGLAVDVPVLAEAGAALRRMTAPDLARLAYPLQERATDRVGRLVRELAGLDGVN
ncbi:hypothetical protein [Methyloversatilis sp.]|uniref:capsular polysaccharide export protein, LipB/KpsS family n=1 Tax=Methyloversatilis sp. TaxID=2569862 RepID=UPI00273374C4|nr:hypothetical protein [Methyloversatilis sp.]MDP2870410.1 hypothetical protein [Methyloversatilis sp.]MDP3457127.1 hypothetical protein [Methyloversatilis sp.]MDP3576786.1 hypothetical protein [Methyloversatilis sp.]